jgi:lipopolysaccharide/colanic/teichoic acid biosynthesis glycosyltransferase
MYVLYLKRVFDLVAAGVLFVIAGPLLALIAAVSVFTLGVPVLWREPRIGRGGRPFRLYKIRSMTNERNATGELLPDSERMTRFGAFLRSTSLDELPELWNVAKGEMSLVGPRPLLPRYVPRYTGEQSRRHEVLPGITGLAQVSGRNELSWEQKFRLDVQYVDRCSFALDVRILALTLWQVICRRGINQPGHATAEEFTGSRHNTRRAG